MERVLDILGLTHQYGFEELETSICNHLENITAIDNICQIYDATLLYSLTDLKEKCEAYIDQSASQLVKHKTFASISPVRIQAYKYNGMAGKSNSAHHLNSLFQANLPSSGDALGRELINEVILS